jgi:hypothetical protein
MQQALSGTNAQLEVITRQAHDWHDQILRLQRSISWRVTSPLRFVRKSIVAFLRGIKALFKSLLLGVAGLLSLPFLPLLLIFIPYVLARPELRNRLGQRIRHYPKLRHALRLSAYKLGLIHHDPRSELRDPKAPLPIPIQEAGQSEPLDVATQNLDHLTPRARQIYYQLVEACKK